MPDPSRCRQDSGRPPNHPSDLGTAHPIVAIGLFRVIAVAYERRSVAISSNIHPDGLDQLLPTTIASVGVDRFMHPAHIVVTEGDSYRLTEAQQGRGVHPLT